MQTTTYPQAPVPNGNNAYLRAKKAAFEFGTLEKVLQKLLERKETILSEMKTPPTPVKAMLAVVAIFVAIVLGFVEANNVKTSIVAASGMNEELAILVGWGFCCLGLLLGEMLSSPSSFKVDEFTGKKTPTLRFYLALALTFVYVAGQVYIAQRATLGVAEELQETVKTMTAFILVIAVIEVVFGVLFLRQSFQMITLFINNLRTKSVMRSMSKFARLTEEYWQRYIFDCQAGGITPQAVSDAIKAATDYYNTAS